MSGIAGIISLNTDSVVDQQDFESFFSCIMINNCTEKAIQQINKNAIVGVGDLTGRKAQYYNSKDKRTNIFIWGDVFLKDQAIKTNEEKHEQICQLWNKHQEKFIDHITGFFVIFIYDTVSSQTCLINCKFGMMPLYYSILDNKLYFSSRLQSFLDLVHFGSSLDKNALLQYLIFNYSIDDSSFVKNVKLLPAASIIVNESSIWKIKKYDTHQWLFTVPSYSYDDGKEVVDKALTKAIQNIAGIDQPIGCAITGGWDGRLILSYLTKMKWLKYFLYTYGKSTHHDMQIAVRLANKYDFEHVPVILDEGFIDRYQDLSEESLLLSGGLRPANRSHYMLMAKMLAKKTRLVISGNCGSNILKIIQGPGAVYNKFVLKLFYADCNLEDAAKAIYINFFENNSWVKQFVSQEEFVSAIVNSEIITDKSIPLGQRFYHFLLTNIERKYFATETSSYSSYIYNYSPFIDSEFIKTIVQTPFYGGHYKFLESNPVVRTQLSKLYAKLMLSNNPGLARFTSDRGFPITWFLNPFGRYAGFMKKKVISAVFSKKQTDPFNHQVGLKNATTNWNLNNAFFNDPEITKLNDELIKAYSWSNWYAKNFK